MPRATPGRLFGTAVLASHWLGCALIVGLMVIVVSDVFMRFLFNAPVTGVNEMMEISIVAMLYLMLAQSLRENRLTRSDALVLGLIARRPRIGRSLEAVFHFAGTLLIAFLIYGSFPRLLQAYEKGLYIGHFGLFVFPEWPLRLTVLAGCILLGIQFSVIGLLNARKVWRG